VLFAHDTTAALLLAADLVNSADLATAAGLATAASLDSVAGLDSVAALEAFLGRHQLEPRRRATAADLDAVLALRPRLRAVWQATGTEDRAGLVNDLLRDSGARPRLVDHGGGWGWHLHVTGHDAALEHRLAAQAGFAFADLVRLGEADRLRCCEAPGCQAVFTDLSRNRSRRYCDTGNCGNRQHVAAYRDRLAAREVSRGA
jgi:predicted RNA-binding Zn ribbon-like protein